MDAFATSAGGAPPAAGAARASSAGVVDTTRILNLFGYVGPVASLMTHALHASSGGGAAAGAGAAAAAALQRIPSLRSRGGGASGGGAAAQPLGTRTRFVVSATEDAMDSCLPCAAERIFKRPSKFGNAAALRFSYQPAAAK